MNLTLQETYLIKDEVSKHFAKVKNVKEWNKKRAELIENWSERFKEPSVITVANTIVTVPKWVVLINRFVDTSGLIVKLLPKNKI